MLPSGTSFAPAWREHKERSHAFSMKPGGTQSTRATSSSQDSRVALQAPCPRHSLTLRLRRYRSRRQASFDCDEGFGMNSSADVEWSHVVVHGLDRSVLKRRATATKSPRFARFASRYAATSCRAQGPVSPDARGGGPRAGLHRAPPSSCRPQPRCSVRQSAGRAVARSTTGAGVGCCSSREGGQGEATFAARAVDGSVGRPSTSVRMKRSAFPSRAVGLGQQVPDPEARRQAAAWA